MRVRPKKRRIGQDEAYLSAKQARAQTAPWFPFPHVNKGRTQGNCRTPRPWTPAPQRLNPIVCGLAQLPARLSTLARGECVKPPVHLKKRPQFLAMRSGVRMNASTFLLEMRLREQDESANAQPRFGFTVTKKIGNAVVRNRIRRRLREAVGIAAANHGKPGHDYVLIGKRSALGAPFASIVAEIAGGLDQPGRFKANPPNTTKGRGKRP